MAKQTAGGRAIPDNLPRPGGGFGHGRRGQIVKPKHFGATVKRLWRYISTEKKQLAVVFGMILLDAVLTLLGPYLIGVAINTIDYRGGLVDFHMLGVAVIALGAAYLGDGIFTFAQGWLMAGIAQRIVKRIRHALFAKLQKLPLAFFDSRPHGEMMSRLANDTDNVSNTLSQTITQLMTGSIAITGSLVMMIAFSPLLTLASLVTVPLVFLLSRTITRKTGLLFKEQQKQLGLLNGHIEEMISGIQIVKAFNHEARAIAEFAAVNEKLRESATRAQVWSGFMMPFLSVINNLGFAIVAIVGGILVVNGHITLGVIASFISYSRQFVRPLNDMANLFNMLQSGVAGAERVFEVMDEQEEEPDSPNAVELANPQGRVEFARVNFGYKPDMPILRNISFTAEPGSAIALVGPTGAGKTTIVNLLTRFYDATGGAITIDGRDIKDYTRDSLRRAFGIVLQDTYLFSGTIRDNIKYGRPDATDREMEEAAALANAAPFIRRLPQQYDTILMENGSNLSQGQRQLLAIARVILAKPAILVLDEATSSIDTRTEFNIQNALLHLMKGRTSFIIAHRLNTIRNADAILVIDRGEISEKGSHDALIGAQGKYYRMFCNQFKNSEGA